MIRGVNKNVIEISDTGNDCFERAILFVRSDKQRGEGDLTAKARRYLSGLRLRRGVLGGGFGRFLPLILSAVGGGVLTAAFFLLL